MPRSPTPGTKKPQTHTTSHILGIGAMRLYRLNWHTRQSGKDVLLHQDQLEAQDAEAAKRKAHALFSDGGAIVGADRIKLYAEGAQEPFWEHP